MTKRTKPKVTPIVAPTISSTAPVSPVESDKAESNTVATPKPKRANNKAPAKPRGRPKKAVVEPKVKINLPAPVSKAVDVAPPIKITYKYDPAWDREPTPSLYDRFVCWLFKVTYLFRGY